MATGVLSEANRAANPLVEILLRPRLYEGALGRSVFTVPSFVSNDECEELIAAASRLLESYGAAARPPRSRLSIASRVDRLLYTRLLALMEAQLPDWAEAIFGQRTNLAEMSVKFSPGEPAVNVYTAGGEFAPHTDKQVTTPNVLKHRA